MQLNLHCDGTANHVTWDLPPEELPQQRTFLLDPISVWTGDKKLTSDATKSLRFRVHKQLEEKTYYQLGPMSPHQFKEIAWKQVYDALCETPRIFGIWACKQVTNIAGVCANQVKYTKD